MIKIELDEDKIEKLIKELVKEYIEKEQGNILIDVNQLCEMVKLSRPTVEKLFLYNPNFPAIRVGKRWVMHLKEVERYLEVWFKDIKKSGGSIDINK